jgi:hypothetical protein
MPKNNPEGYLRKKTKKKPRKRMASSLMNSIKDKAMTKFSKR